MVTNIEQFQQRKENSLKIDKIIIITSILMLMIIPNFVYKKEFMSYTPILSNSAYASGMRADVFNYYKSVMLNVGAFFMLMCYTYKVVVLKQEFRKDKINIVVLLLALVILISSIMSEYPQIAFFGNHDRFEGGMAWFSYLSIFFVLYNTNIDEKYYKFYYLSLVVFIIINSVTSITYLYGINLLDIPFINQMLGGGLSGYIVTTLYHPNFGSGISAVIFCTSFMYFILEDNVQYKAILLFLTTFSFAMLLAMVSTGGFLTVLIMIPIMIVVGVRIKGIKYFTIFGVMSLVFNIFIYNLLNSQSEKVFNESMAIIEKVNSISNIIIPITVVLFLLVLLSIKFIDRKKIFKIFSISFGVLVTVFLLIAPKILSSNIDEIKSNETYHKINEISTDRINIWIKTLNLSKDHSLIGSGADTLPFNMVLRDEDKGMSTYNEFIDKPHNWYLSIFYSFGILGFILFMIIVIDFIYTLFNNIDDKNRFKYGYIYGIGTITYLVQSLSNDSFTGTAIIFWVMISIIFNKIKQKNAT